MEIYGFISLHVNIVQIVTNLSAENFMFSPDRNPFTEKN